MKSGLRAPPLAWPAPARAGRGRRAARDYAGRIAPRAGARSGQAWHSGVRGQRALARQPTRGFGHAGRPGAAATAATPRPAGNARTGGRRPASGRYRSVAARRSSRSPAPFPAPRPACPSGDWPCASTTTGPAMGTGGLAALQRRAANARAAAGRQPFAGGFDVLLAQPLQHGVGIGRAVSASGAGGGSATPGSAAAGRAHPPPARTPWGRRLFQHLSSALAETTFSAWAGYSSATRQPPGGWRC